MTTKGQRPPERRARRIGLHVRVSDRARSGVQALAAKRRVPVHSIVEAAIDAYLSPAAQDNRDAMIGRQINRLSRGVETLDFNSKLVVAMLRYLVELDLSYLPEPADEADRREISAKGARRFDRFEQWLSKQLVDPENLYQRLQTKITADPDQA